jgi:hypothetical protein
MSKARKKRGRKRPRPSRVGRRVRLDDGTEVVVLGDPFGEDEW